MCPGRGGEGDMTNLDQKFMKAPSKRRAPRAPKPRMKPKQELALQMLGEGNSLAQVAESTKIDRKTLYRWLYQDPRFRAAYNWWKREAEQAARARLIAGGEMAATALVNAATGRGGVDALNLRAAQILLKALGFLTPQPPGPVQPANAMCEIKLEAKRETNQIGQQIAIEYFNPDELEDVPEGRDLNARKPVPGVAEDDPD